MNYIKSFYEFVNESHINEISDALANHARAKAKEKYGEYGVGIEYPNLANSNNTDYKLIFSRGSFTVNRELVGNQRFPLLRYIIQYTNGGGEIVEAILFAVADSDDPSTARVKFDGDNRLLDVDPSEFGLILNVIFQDIIQNIPVFKNFTRRSFTLACIKAANDEEVIYPAKIR